MSTKAKDKLTDPHAQSRARRDKKAMLARMEMARDELLAEQNYISQKYGQLKDSMPYPESCRHEREVLGPHVERVRMLRTQVFHGLAEWAGVTRLEEFTHYIFKLIYNVHEDDLLRSNDDGLRNVATKLQEALGAACALSADAIVRLGWILGKITADDGVLACIAEEVGWPEDNPDFVRLLWAMTTAAARTAGTSPDITVARKRGRREGDVARWPLEKFIREFWNLVRICGGDLSFSRKDNVARGEMVVVLNFLRPLLPSGMIPEVLPGPTIEKVKKQIERHRLTKRSKVPAQI